MSDTHHAVRRRARRREQGEDVQGRASNGITWTRTATKTAPSSTTRSATSTTGIASSRPRKWAGSSAAWSIATRRRSRSRPASRARSATRGNTRRTSTTREYKLKVSWPQIVAAAANELFLGPQTGVDEDSGCRDLRRGSGTRLYTPLTRAEYDSIAARTTYHPEVSQRLRLVHADQRRVVPPAGGPASASPRTSKPATRPTSSIPIRWRSGITTSAGRTRTATVRAITGAAATSSACRLRQMLELSTAGRYDSYHFGGNDVGKFTYNFGLEFRPIDTLAGARLLRHRLPRARPALRVRRRGPGRIRRQRLLPVPHRGARRRHRRLLVRRHRRHRDPQRQPRARSPRPASPGARASSGRPTTTSWSRSTTSTSSSKTRCSNLRVDTVLQDEADCRLGETTNGTPVDINSPTCLDALARVDAISGRRSGRARRSCIACASTRSTSPTRAPTASISASATSGRSASRH